MQMPFFEAGDPAKLWRRRVQLDAVLAAFFFIVVLDRLTENPLHEILGFLLGGLAFMHILLNRRWCVRRLKALFGVEEKSNPRSRRNRKPTLRDRLAILVNVPFMLLFAASWVSGIMCSQTLFAAATPDAWRMDLIYRTVHVALSMWCFFAAALHVGLHGRICFAKATKAFEEELPGGVKIALAALFLVLLAMWSANAFVFREMNYLLGFESAFIYVEQEELPFAMPADLLVMGIFLAALLHAGLVLAEKRW